MRKNKIFIICLMLLSLVITCVAMAFLPDSIPTHLGVNGKPDQFGSKYFIFMFPVINILVGLSMLLVCKYAKVSENYRKYTLTTGVLIQLIFLCMNVVFILYAINYADGSLGFDVSKIIMVVFGILFILMGNYMPKIEKNRTLGFKIKWSLYNEVTWQKTHRFVGFGGIITGILCIISGLIFKEMVNFIILMSLIFILMVSTSVASYKYYKEEKAKEE